jgi:hypothetical protein
MPSAATLSAKREGTIGRELEAVLTLAIALLAEDRPLPNEIATMHWEETGATIESATSGPICC